ncbi:oligosaccharide flippase family protein [Pontitalea aquivivens]|uniref:oligosaccharide flippase family protein n=1 Tax=Pontitalea aquivivens TaxID=3388663 RepID=UPI0039709406
MSGTMRGGVLTAVSRVFSQGAQFLIFLFAAKIMAPAEFGVFAMVSAWSMLLAMVAGAGWAEYVMQWQGPVVGLRRVLSMALISGAAMTGVALGISLLAGLVTSNPQVAPLMQLFALTILLASAGNTVAGIMNWQDRLSAAALTAIIADLVHLVVSVVALRAGYGVFALAFGRIAGTFMWLALGLAVVRLVPASRVPREDLRAALRFWARIVVVRLMTNLRVHTATFIVGGAFGAAAAGYYRVGERLSLVLSEVLGEPTRVLAWSLFRRSRDAVGGTTGFRARANRFFPALLAISVPLFACLALFAEDVTVGLLGDQWRPATPVVQVLALAQALFATGFALEPILSLAGAVRVMPVVVALNASAGIALVLIAAPYGMVATAWAQVVAGMVAFVVNARVLGHYAGISWGRILARSWRGFLAASVALGAALALRGAFPLDGVQALLRAVAGSVVLVGVYAGVLLALDGRLRRTLRRVGRPIA